MNRARIEQQEKERKKTLLFECHNRFSYVIAFNNAWYLNLK
jgi:hypothetical protein